MNIQNIIIYLVFAAALFYVGRKIWKMIHAKDEHDGCNKCNTSKK
ncbi:MAG: FeoB-associated Cys-rich membrane protein [Bacteroidia bacterium]